MFGRDLLLRMDERPGKKGEGAQFWARGEVHEARRPVRLVWYETFETKEEAMSREVKVKRLSRKQKDELVAYGPVEKPIS